MPVLVRPVQVIDILLLTRIVRPRPRKMSSPSSTHIAPHHYTSNDDKSPLAADGVPAVYEAISSEDDSTLVGSAAGSSKSRTSSRRSDETQSHHQIVHTVKLSSLEHCMPRSYIRIVMAYKLPNGPEMDQAIDKLQKFVRKIVRAKPYLAGKVVAVDLLDGRGSRPEIVFTAHDYRYYPAVRVDKLVDDNGQLLKYDKLDEAACPPSWLPPEIVLKDLKPDVDPKNAAPVFRMQVNVLDGGMVIALYLHHVISDGTGLDLITSGQVLDDQYTFLWRPEFAADHDSNLDAALAQFAREKSEVRNLLSQAPERRTNIRQIRAVHLDQPPPPKNPPGRGCIIQISQESIVAMKKDFNKKEETSGKWHTTNSILMALLWRHMIRARRSTVPDIQSSTLLIPANLRTVVEPNLPQSYFGAAVDCSRAEMDLDTLVQGDADRLFCISQTIREATNQISDAYVKELISFANKANSTIDLADIQASNMDRVNGADMYITSWMEFGTYKHDLGMGIGGPDWVRKPWSRDPGSCIILPRDDRKDYLEAVVQMTNDEMTRLLQDEEFLRNVVRVID